MNISHRLTLVALLLSAVLVAGCAAEPGRPRPALVVVVVVDGLPQHHIDRMRQDLPADGLIRRLARDGARFDNAAHRHAFTETAVGHATLLTGAFPMLNGITGNTFCDRSVGKWFEAIEDDAFPEVGKPPQSTPTSQREEGVSPRRLLVPTVGDMLKLATAGRGRVFGVSLKDRAAVLMAGHAADAAFWFDLGSQRWVTSTYYRDALPDYLARYNHVGPLAYAGQRWTLLLEADRYPLYRPDDYEANVKPPLSAGFPHALPPLGNDYTNYAKAMVTGPFGVDMTLAVARLVVQNEQLGRDDVPDLLAINLASNDYVHHAFGPLSLESQDMLLQTDRLLGRFAAFLDRQLAGRPYVIVLTSDHGFTADADFLAERKLPAGRRLLDERAMSKAIEARLRDAFGAPADKAKYVLDIGGGEVMLNRQLLDGQRLAEAQRLCRDALLADDAVAVAYAADTLLTSDATTGLLGSFRLTFHPRRSGDVLYGLRPGVTPGGSGGSHGSPWVHDRRVPLMIAGPGVRPGRFGGEACPAQIAPTLARLLNVQRPMGCQVEPLEQVLRD